MRAWTFQDTRQKKKLGGDKCPWSVGWYDPDGNKRSKTIGSKSMAEKFRRKKEGELAAGLCQVGATRVRWDRFRQEYEETIMPKWRSAVSRRAAVDSLDMFENLVKPMYVTTINEKTLDTFVAKRLTMRGKKKNETVSPETVRKDLRTIRAALGQAKRWKYLAQVPATPEVDGYGKDKPFVTDKHFDAIMEACDTAKRPKDQHVTAAEFWKALLAMAWVTGMRKSALLSLLWDDVDFEAGIALSRYGHNKGKRDQRHKIGAAANLLGPLHRVRKPGERRVFPWNYSLRTLDRDLAEIQKAAGIHLECREDHEHTPACYLYGFHSFRYAHATYNFGRVTDRDLQEQMGHASFATTQRYIKYAEAHQSRAYDVYLPDSLKKGIG